MRTYLLLALCSIFSICTLANTIQVKNADELKAANKNAKPGDIIILKNGDWNNITLSLTCKGTEPQPITFKSETPGKVIIKGNSKLRLGGDYIVVDGLYFTEGYAGNDAVIDYRASKNQLANHCRVTNCAIKSFNNPKRLDENYWVSFSGKNNRLDHCSFVDKKNLGVLIAVILDDDNSRQNFHSIDHNYFGYRLPLASNGGEIIRIGVSQHALFNSNTQVTDNFFEHCDGETEVISVKSCANVVRNNLFKECQGGVVLRHGNNNTVENNIFLGNNKEGTGGVRIINGGQWVVNNLFYKCRGVDFRSPMSLMNGIFNSPVNRYVQVTDAVVWGNSFVDCSAISFGEGSDTERTEAPKRVIFGNNIFYNNIDKKIYNIYDKVDGMRFRNNVVNTSIPQQTIPGINKATINARPISGITIPSINKLVAPDDSLRTVALTRLGHELSKTPGFAGDKVLNSVLDNAKSLKNMSDVWKTSDNSREHMSDVLKTSDILPRVVNCKNADEVLYQIKNIIKTPMIINLTGDKYHFEYPIEIESDVTLKGIDKKKKISFSTSTESLYLIQLKGGHRLSLKDLNLDLSEVKSDAFVITDTSGSSDHEKFFQDGCTIHGWNGSFFRAVKSNVLDSIIISNNSFSNTSGLLFDFVNENDKKGYYNVEKLIIKNNHFDSHRGQLLGILRGGNDESTMGPYLLFEGNALTGVGLGYGNTPLIWLYGVQRSIIQKNNFKNSNPEGPVILYEDAVRADHLLRGNVFFGSGGVVKDKFVNE